MNGAEIPAGFSLVRRIGPFDAASLPAGLLSSHTLKAGLIPPEAPHHLEVTGPFELAITFLEREGAV